MDNKNLSKFQRMWMLLILITPLLATNPEKVDILFLGNSITHSCLYPQYIEDFYFTHFPNKKMNFHNAGVSGDKAADALIRFHDEVAIYQPDTVTILLGMNDGKYQPFDKDIFETYRNGMTQLLDSIQKIGAYPIILSPTYYDSPAGGKMDWFRGQWETLAQYNGVLAYFDAWLREIARQRNIGYVDLRSNMELATRNQRKFNSDYTFIPDGVHPNDRDTLFKYSEALQKCFSNPIEIGDNIQATNIRGNSRKFAAQNLFDSDADSYWATDNDINRLRSQLILIKKLSLIKYCFKNLYRLVRESRSSILKPKLTMNGKKSAMEQQLVTNEFSNFPK